MFTFVTIALQPCSEQWKFQEGGSGNTSYPPMAEPKKELYQRPEVLSASMCREDLREHCRTVERRLARRCRTGETDIVTDNR